MIQLTYIISILLTISTLFYWFFTDTKLFNLKKIFSSPSKNFPIWMWLRPYVTPPRMPFSIQFFLISLIFLIFDIEIALLIPLIHMFKMFNLPMILTSVMFIMIMIFGLFLEYTEQSIDWKI